MNKELPARDVGESFYSLRYLTSKKENEWNWSFLGIFDLKLSSSQFFFIHSRARLINLIKETNEIAPKRTIE